MARITLYTDREIMALGLGQAVLPFHDLEIRGLNSLTEAAPIGRTEVPALLLILDAPPEASHLISRIRSVDPGVPLVVWARGRASEPALNALGSGAHGVLLDISTTCEIRACLDTVLDDGVWIPPSIAQAYATSRRCKLTRRESQLISLVSGGMSNKELAGVLGITVGTVKVYLSRLFEKVDVSDRYELALLGLRQGGSGNAGPQAGSSAQSVYVEVESLCPQSVIVPRVHENWQTFALPGARLEEMQLSVP